MRRSLTAHPPPSRIAGRRRRRRQSRGCRGRERRRVHRRHRGPREAPRAREEAVRRPRGSERLGETLGRKDENEKQARRSRRRPRADADGHCGGVLAAVLSVRGRPDGPVLADPRRARRRPQRRRRRGRRLRVRRVPRGPASIDGRREGDHRCDGRGGDGTYARRAFPPGRRPRAGRHRKRKRRARRFRELRRFRVGIAIGPVFARAGGRRGARRRARLGVRERLRASLLRLRVRGRVPGPHGARGAAARRQGHRPDLRPAAGG